MLANEIFFSYIKWVSSPQQLYSYDAVDARYSPLECLWIWWATKREKVQVELIREKIYDWIDVHRKWFHAVWVGVPIETILLLKKCNIIVRSLLNLQIYSSIGNMHKLESILFYLFIKLLRHNFHITIMSWQMQPVYKYISRLYPRNVPALKLIY